MDTVETIPSWVDDYMPFAGPCGLCGGPDQRHRVIEAIVERVQSGDSPEEVANDYGYDVEFIDMLVDEFGE